jgi:FKBP-type peptidyl-prolyl cis-trans isomerase FklB
MRKNHYRFLSIPAAGLIFCGMTLAQQSSAPTPQQPSGQQPSASKPATATKKPAASTQAAKPVTLDTQTDKASYAIGLNIGKSMKRDGVDVNADLLLKGMKDALADAKPLLTDEEVQQVLSTLQNEVRKHQQEVYQEALKKNKDEGDAFLEANKAKPDVVTLPSGLQYKVLQAGDGPKPTATDTVNCNYRGTLINGTEFDSSYKTGKPAQFAVSRVIKGWTEALQLMPVGSKWELYIPPSLAYGERGGGATIGPDSTLIFQVELVSIQPKPAPPAPKLEMPGGQPAPGASQPQAQPQSQQAPAQTPPATQPAAKP